MAFKKARAEQAALKMSMYGPPGSGKTATALLIAEGLAEYAKKRVAFVDTERGTDFYVQSVQERSWHPHAFDIDALYSRSLMEVLKEAQALKPDEHGVLVIDSISHLWDAARASYTGQRTRQGGIPMHAWDKIKAPYKALMHWIINSPIHVLILGRQGTDFEESEDGELKAVGIKMRAEKETAYEPHVCIRMETVFERKAKTAKKVGLGVPTAFVEKDRASIIHGMQIPWPNFDNIARPLLGLLGGKQAQILSEEETANQDIESIQKQEREKFAASKILRDQWAAKLDKTKSMDELKTLGDQLSADSVKMLREHVDSLRGSFSYARERLLAGKAAPKEDEAEQQEREAIEKES